MKIISKRSLREGLAEYKSADFVEKKNKEKRALRPKTQKNRKILFTRLEKFLDSNGLDINKDSIKKFHDSLRRTNPTKKYPKGKDAAPGTVYKYGKKLTAFCNFLIQKKYTEEDLGELLVLPPEDETFPEPVHLDLDFEKIPWYIKLGTSSSIYDRSASRKAKRESYWAMTFMLTTGIRSGGWGDGKLSGSDLHFEARDPYYIATMKGGKRLPFPMPDENKELVAALYKRRNRKKVFDVTTRATIDHFRRGLLLGGVPKEIVEKVDNHSFRKLFAQERKDNGVDVEDIADAMGDKAETVKKYYLNRSMKTIKNTFNNSRIIRHGLPTDVIIEKIRGFIKIYTMDDDRFNPLAAQQALDIDKLLKPAA